MSDGPELIDLQPGYAMVPRWILRGGFSSRAVHLYGLLKDYARQSDAAFPGREKLRHDLADQAGPMSIATVDRAIRELVDRGALRVKRRGLGMTNVYGIAWDPPAPESSQVTTQEVAPVTTAEVAPVTTPIRKNKQEKNTPPGGGWEPVRVNGKIVTPTERDLCDAILAEFNRQAGTSYSGAVDHRRMIVGRIREAPDLELRSHARIIRVAFADAWWTGTPGPQVIYGKAGVFETARERARNAKDVPAALTDEQIAERRRREEDRQAIEHRRGVEDFWRAEVAAGRITQEEADRELAAWHEAQRSKETAHAAA